MLKNKYPVRQSHGDGSFTLSQFKSIGENVIFEKGVLVFHPESIIIGSNVYIGHNTILKGYHKGVMEIGSGTWIGQGCFFHSAGGIKIGECVGIGPGVKILSSEHEALSIEEPILLSSIKFEKVTIEDWADIGVDAIILPGVRVGKGSIIGAGAVVTKDVPPYVISVGNPSKLLRERTN